MSLKKFVAVFGVAASIMIGLSTPVFAAFSYDPASTAVSSKSVDAVGITNLIGNIANILIGIIAAISVFYIIYGAVVWMNDGADKGKVIVVNAVVGLVICILAFFIVQFAVGTGGWLNNALNKQ